MLDQSDNNASNCGHTTRKNALITGTHVAAVVNIPSGEFNIQVSIS